MRDDFRNFTLSPGAFDVSDFEPDLTFDRVKPSSRLLPAGKLLRRRATSRRMFNFSAITNAVALLKKLPEAGETFHLAMDTSFNGYDLIAAVIQLADQPCRELVVSTLATNQRAVAGFKGMMDAGQLGKLTVALSVYFRDADREACQQITAALKSIGAAVHTLRIHAKLCLFDFGNRHFVAEGSGNLRSCRCIEQLALTNDRQLFDFYHNTVKNIVKHETDTKK